MQILDREASGGRHLVWLAKIIAMIQAHLEINTLLTAVQRGALQPELVNLQRCYDKLAAAYAEYRHFLDHAYVGLSAKQRVANYLCDVALEKERGSLLGAKREAEQAVPGIVVRYLDNMPLSKALSIGNEATVTLLRHAADVLSLLPDDRFGFANAAENNLRGASDRLEGFNKERTELEDKRRAPLRFAVERAILDLRETVAQVNGRLRTNFDDRFIDSLYPELDTKGRGLADDEEAAPPPAAPPA